MELLDFIKNKARKHQKRIVLPEGTEIRTLQAANELLKEKIAQIILVGNTAEINKIASSLKLEYLKDAEIVDPITNPKKEEYIALFQEIRGVKCKGRKQAREMAEDQLYCGALMVKAGDADGMVAGAENTTANVLRPALQVIKTSPGISVVSDAFVMLMPDKKMGDMGMLLFANCAVCPDPDENQLAEIAISSAQTAKSLMGLEPRVAMLSFSTRGSACHPMVAKVTNATKIAQEKAPDLVIDGELQVDAAIVNSVALKKAPDSPLRGSANVLVFPSLDVGNISYKLVQRLAGAEAIGPIFQGISSPVNDLSRGCSVVDIINVVSITAVQSCI